MAYQFIHVEGYGRVAGKGKKGGHNVASIIAEAERLPGACPHVEAPQTPTLLYGCSPQEAGERALAWASQAKDARGHALRKDGNCLLAGVVSLPRAMADRWGKYTKDTLHWLRREYGNRLLSVVEHRDEAHPHLHFYIVPRDGERFDTIHAGLRAANAVNPDRGNRKLSPAEKAAGRKMARTAYVEAMRDWQDSFHVRVSRRYGLARIGPAKARLSRAEHQAQKASNEAMAAWESDLERREQAVAAREATQEARDAAEREKAQRFVAEEVRKLKEWAAAYKVEAVRQAKEWIKKHLTPEMYKALERSLDRGVER